MHASRLGRTRLCVAASILAVALGTVHCGETGSSGPEVLELSLGHVQAPDSLFAVTTDEFARRVNDELSGRVVVSVFGASQLGSDEVAMQKLKLGTLDFALVSTVMSSTVDAFGLFEMPYLVRDREHMQQIEEAVVWPTLAPRAEEEGYTLVALWENGFRHVTNNLRPIATPEDLQGIKLRTPSGAWRVRLFQALGASPAPMAFSELFVALQTGVMDGQENPLAQIYSSKFQEVQTYLSLTGHVYSPAFLVVGSAQWNQIPQETREAITRIARETQPFAFEAAARMDREMLEALRAAGMEVNEPDREAFVAASQAVYEEFGAAVPEGSQMIETALALGR